MFVLGFPTHSSLSLRELALLIFTTCIGWDYPIISGQLLWILLTFLWILIDVFKTTVNISPCEYCNFSFSTSSSSLSFLLCRCSEGVWQPQQISKHIYNNYPHLHYNYDTVSITLLLSSEHFIVCNTAAHCLITIFCTPCVSYMVCDHTNQYFTHWWPSWLLCPHRLLHADILPTVVFIHLTKQLVAVWIKSVFLHVFMSAHVPAPAKSSV